MGGVFYKPNGRKKSNLNLLVVRVNKAGEVCNARPCYNCLNLMKVVGIKKIYYTSSDGELVCEIVKDMISIQSSYATKYFDNLRETIHFDSSDDYYDRLLKRYFPAEIKLKNLDNFIKHNFTNVLPKYNIIKDKSYIKIYSEKNELIVQSILKK